MNYGRRNAVKMRKSLTSASPMLEKKAGVSLIRVLFIGLLAVLIIGGCAGIGVFRGLIDNAPDIEDVTASIVPVGEATFVLDENGAQLQKLTAPTSNRMSVSLTKIPENLQNAVVAVEDERFYKHNGIDYRGIIRAFVTGIKNKFRFNEGASTITQQLLKNNVFTNWTSEDSMIDRMKRKIQEQYLAVQLEKELTKKGENAKETILENYMNTINLGAGTYGVQAAAKRYFNKNVEELTLSECTVIAGITKNPAAYNPISHPDQNAKRRKKVLNDMKAQGFITEAQKQEALDDNVYERIAEASEITGATTVYSYFVDELTEQIIEDLMTQKGYKEEQAYQYLYSGGLKIYTTQDPAIQQICDEEYQNPANFPENVEYSMDWALTLTDETGETENYSKEMLAAYFRKSDENFDLLFTSEEEAQSYIDQYKKAIMEEKKGWKILAERSSFAPQPQSSICVMDQSTGYVKAIVGGRGTKEASLTLNRATNTERQPGSTFKVLSTYAPGIDTEAFTLATKVKDEPYAYTNGRQVKNWLTNTYQGDITVRFAIEQSVNVVAVKCITQITPKLGFDYLMNFGFTSLVDSKEVNGQVFSDIVQPLALGGITYGVSNLELTSAYATIANKGNHIKPIFYTRIVDSKDNVIIDNTPETTSVLKESTAYLLTSAMESVVTEGTGVGLELDNMPVAGKTGTTSDYNDVWFAGYTPYYTCAVWAGYDNNEKLPENDIYRSYHRILWKKIMQRIHDGLPRVEFAVPSSVSQVTLCTKSGLLANSGCPTTTEYFDKKTVPTEHCNIHGGYSSSSSYSYTPPSNSTTYYDYDDEDEEEDQTPPANTPEEDTPTPDADTQTPSNQPTGGNTGGTNQTPADDNEQPENDNQTGGTANDTPSDTNTNENIYNGGNDNPGETGTDGNTGGGEEAAPF